MFLRSTIVFASLTVLLSAKSEIDLTPSVKEYIGEGIKYQRLIFRQDKERIEYNPPPGWTFSGSSDRVQLMPPKKSFAEAVIQAAPLPAPMPLDEKTTKALEQQFIAGLPEGGQFVTVVSEEQNAVPIDGNPSFEVTVSYQLMGEKFLKSAIFVHAHNVQVIFRLTARKDDFEALHREFKRSTSSWHWLESDDEAGSVTKAAAAAPVPTP